MSVSVRVVSEIERDRQVVFDYVTAPENMSKFFRAVGPVPGVARAHVLGNGPVVKNAVRRVVLTDGSPLDEEITDHESPRSHRYRVKGLRPPLRYLVKYMDSELVFSPLGSGTRVTWTYSFEPRNALATPLVSLFANRLFKRSMIEAVARVREAL